MIRRDNASYIHRVQITCLHFVYYDILMCKSDDGGSSREGRGGRQIYMSGCFFEFSFCVGFCSARRFRMSYFFFVQSLFSNGGFVLIVSFEGFEYFFEILQDLNHTVSPQDHQEHANIHQRIRRHLLHFYNRPGIFIFIARI